MARPAEAWGPPLAICEVIAVADRPSALKPAADVVEPSVARIWNSFRASATVSVSRAPAFMPWESRPVAVVASRPIARKIVEYSLKVSARSSALGPMTCMPRVMTSMAVWAFGARPVFMIWPTALADWPRSMSNVPARSETFVAMDWIWALVEPGGSRPDDMVARIASAAPWMSSVTAPA